MRAQATLALMVVLSIVMIEITTLISTVSLIQFENKIDEVAATKALAVLDAGVEEALYHFHSNEDYTGGTVVTPDGNAVITVIDGGEYLRTVNVVTSNTDVLRSVSLEIHLTPVIGNPIVAFGIFGGDDIEVDGNNVLFRGDFRANDNLRIYGNAVIEGDAYLSGAGTSSNSRLRNYGRIKDNSTTSPAVEGNLFSVDDIFIENNGTVEGNATTNKEVKLFGSGAVLGTINEFANLNINSVPIPQFNFTDAKATAQANGTYYTTPNAFLNAVALNGNTISSGVYYIQTNQDLVFPVGQTYNFNGTIVSEGVIDVRATTYNHTADSEFPVLVSQKDIFISDSTNCNCKTNITGALFALDDIDINRDQYTGTGYSVDLDGILWAGDSLTIKNNVRFIYNPTVSEQVSGFDFDLGEGDEPNSYRVNVDSVSIN